LYKSEVPQAAHHRSQKKKMKIPGLNSGPNPQAASPRMVAMGSRRSVLPKSMNLVLPITLLFALGGIAYTFKWNSDRQKEGNGVCIDCARQREMVEEVYFNKKNDSAHKGYRL
jgi:hypothetical protein